MLTTLRLLIALRLRLSFGLPRVPTVGVRARFVNNKETVSELVGTVNNLFQMTVASNRCADIARLMATQLVDLSARQKSLPFRFRQRSVKCRPPAVLPHAEDLESLHHTMLSLIGIPWICSRKLAAPTQTIENLRLRRKARLKDPFGTATPSCIYLPNQQSFQD
jgi:hypothetical protein